MKFFPQFINKIILSFSLVLAIASVHAMIEEGIEEQATRDNDPRENRSRAAAAEQQRREEASVEEEITSRGTQVSLEEEESSCPKKDILPNNNNMDIMNKSSVLPPTKASWDRDPSIDTTARESDSDHSGELDGMAMKTVLPESRLRSALKRAKEFRFPDEAAEALEKAEPLKKVVWSPSVILNDRMGSLMEKMNDLQKEARQVCSQVSQQRFTRPLETPDLSNDTQLLSWRDAYQTTLEPAAQQAVELVNAFPPEATFKQKTALIKRVADVTHQALGAAYSSMRELRRAKRAVQDKEASIGKSIESVKKDRELLENSRAIRIVKENVEKEIDAALECFDKMPEEMKVFLASREKANAFNNKEILKQLLAEQVVREGTKSSVSSGDLDGVIPPSGGKNIFNQEGIEISTLHQAAIEHAITTCQKALGIARLLQEDSLK